MVDGVTFPLGTKSNDLDMRTVSAEVYATNGIFDQLHMTASNLGSLSLDANMATFQEMLGRDQIVVAAKRAGGVTISRAMIAQYGGHTLLPRYSLLLPSNVVGEDVQSELIYHQRQNGYIRCANMLYTHVTPEMVSSLVEVINLAIDDVSVATNNQALLELKLSV